MDKRGAHHLGLGYTADMTETGGGYDLGVPFAADPPRDIEIQLVAAVFRQLRWANSLSARQKVVAPRLRMTHWANFCCRSRLRVSMKAPQ